jgi:hypothetical protein
MKKGLLIITAIFAFGLMTIVADAATRNPALEDFTNSG